MPNVDASEVQAAQGRIQEGMEGAMTAAQEEACLQVEGDAKRSLTHNQSGALRRSITHIVTNEGGKLAGYVGSNLEYAPYIHQGTGIYAMNSLGRKNVPWRYCDSKGEWHTTKGITPSPFLQQAVDKNRQEILNFFKGVQENANSGGGN